MSTNHKSWLHIPKLRRLLAGAMSVDVQGTGRLSYRALLQGLRMVQVMRVREGSGAGVSFKKRRAAGAAAGGAGGAETWELERWEPTAGADRGGRFLLDRRTMRAYREPRGGWRAGGAAWPELAGVAERGGALRPARLASDLVAVRRRRLIHIMLTLG